MADLLVLRLWRHSWPARSALATMLVVFLWPALPLGGVYDWLLFLYYYSPENILYTFLTLLSGLYVGIYVYNRKVCATCRIDGREVNGKAGAAGVVGGVLLGACPACIPALGIFLPLGASMFLSRISWVFLVLAVLLLLFLIYRMNGFRRVESVQLSPNPASASLPESPKAAE